MCHEGQQVGLVAPLPGPSFRTMLGIVIKLLDQRSYSRMFYSQIIRDDVGDSHQAVKTREVTVACISQIIPDDVGDSH